MKNLFQPTTVESIVAPLQNIIAKLERHQAGMREEAEGHRGKVVHHLAEAALKDGAAERADAVLKKIKELIAA